EEYTHSFATGDELPRNVAAEEARCAGDERGHGSVAFLEGVFSSRGQFLSRGLHWDVCVRRIQQSGEALPTAAADHCAGFFNHFLKNSIFFGGKLATACNGESVHIFLVEEFNQLADVASICFARNRKVRCDEKAGKFCRANRFHRTAKSVGTASGFVV